MRGEVLIIKIYRLIKTILFYRPLDDHRTRVSFIETEMEWITVLFLEVKLLALEMGQSVDLWSTFILSQE